MTPVGCKMISSLLKWAETWQMRFNSKKCHILSISRQRNKSSPVYYLGTDLLNTVSSHTYLGITVSSDLKCMNIFLISALRQLGLLTLFSVIHIVVSKKIIAIQLVCLTNLAGCPCSWHSGHPAGHRTEELYRALILLSLALFRAPLCLWSSWCYILIKKFFCLHPSLYLLVRWAWWDWPLTWLTNHHPSVLWHCWLDHLTHIMSPKLPICVEWDVIHYYTIQ